MGLDVWDKARLCCLTQGFVLFAELASEVSKLPGALQSLTPELLIDYLATILKLEDAQPRQWCGLLLLEEMWQSMQVAAINDHTTACMIVQPPSIQMRSHDRHI